MDRLYAQFVRPGDLVFDIGAHVGDRIACFRRLGARVVAVEPQPALVKTLRLLYGRDRAVTIEPVAVGAQAGSSHSSSISTIRPCRPRRRFRSRRRGRAGLGRPGLDAGDPRPDHDARRADRAPRRARLHQDRRRGIRGRGAGRPDAAGAGAVVRIHHHPARGGGGLHRALPGARLCPLQRRARREPDARPSGLAERAADRRTGSPACRSRPIPAMSMQARLNPSAGADTKPISVKSKLLGRCRTRR